MQEHCTWKLEEDLAWCFHWLWRKNEKWWNIKERTLTLVFSLFTWTPWIFAGLIFFFFKSISDAHISELRADYVRWRHVYHRPTTDVLCVRLRCCSNYFSNLGLKPELMSLSRLQPHAFRNLPSTTPKVMHFDDRLKAWVKRAAGRPSTCVCGRSHIMMVSQLVAGIARCWHLLTYHLLNPVFSPWPQQYQQ